MQLYKHNTSHDSTHKQARGRSIDAILFVEELAEIYSTPTPNAMAKARKIVLIECSLYNNQALIFIPKTQIWIILKYDSLQFLE